MLHAGAAKQLHNCSFSIAEINKIKGEKENQINHNDIVKNDLLHK